MKHRKPTIRDVIAHPEPHATTPGVDLVARELEIAARCPTFRPDRIGPALHQITGEPILDRIRARAAEIGRTRPAPLICPGAVS